MRMSAAARAGSPQQRRATGQFAQWWWLWLIGGAIWILVGIFILQLDRRSITVAGLTIGILLLVAGAEEFVMAYVVDGLKWLWYIFGAILLISGIWVLFNPTKTVAAVAQSLGFIFALVGIFWIIEAIMTKDANQLWVLGLISGIILVGLGFWAGGQIFPVQVYTLLIFTGIWGLLHGITDIFKAFTIRRLGKMTAAVV
jgi:uncharacterized membrane protein HdeD (DUF308 family)